MKRFSIAAPVGQLTFDKFNARRQQIAPAVAQIVKNNCLMSLFGKQSRNCTTDIPGTAGNQYLHKKDCPFHEHFRLP